MHLDGNITKEDITEERKLRENNKPDEVRDNEAIEIKRESVKKVQQKRQLYLFEDLELIKKKKKKKVERKIENTITSGESWKDF